MAEIQLTGVKKTYANKLQVIHGVDVAIADGEFIVIVGPSGCGKSTLLRMIAGLEPITEGEIAIGGKRRERGRAQGPQHRDGVPELRALPAHERVREHGVRPAHPRARPRRTSRRACSAPRRSSSWARCLQRKPRELSGGQRQRVAMGRAIVREPAAFLFDEPLSNLDAKLRVQMRLEIQKLHRELKTTSIFVTHDQVEAMTLADRMIVMNLGVRRAGRPPDRRLRRSRPRSSSRASSARRR